MRRALSRPVMLVAALVALTLPATARAGCWYPPVVAPVVDPFRAPDCRWCPGNRGVEFGTRPGTVVVAAATGTVTFSGRVVGRGYVVVRHGDGRRVTYGGLSTWQVRSGDLVLAGRPIGTTSGHLHLGMRDGDVYLDPAPFLGRLVRRPWLVPTGGDPPVAAPPPQLRCGR